MNLKLDAAGMSEGEHDTAMDLRVGVPVVVLEPLRSKASYASIAVGMASCWVQTVVGSAAPEAIPLSRPET